MLRIDLLVLFQILCGAGGVLLCNAFIFQSLAVGFIAGCVFVLAYGVYRWMTLDAEIPEIPETPDNMQPIPCRVIVGPWRREG